MYTENIPIDGLSEILAEMSRKGKRRSLAQSKEIERDYGVKIAPHILAEFKYYERKKWWNSCQVG
jgi:hypothetical protein